MNDKLPPSYRRERIERLLRELQYEVTRGVMEKEIDERISFNFIVPISHTLPNGVVRAEFRAAPVPHWAVSPFDRNHLELKLKDEGKKDDGTE